MRIYLVHILFLLIPIQLASCQNKKTIMKDKFDWIESISSPLGYPAEIYRGGLLSEDGNYTSLYLGATTGEWGEGGGGMRGGVKQLPNRLEAIWISYAEGVVYEINTAIDYDKLLKLFNEGYYVPSKNSDVPEPRQENFDEIIVGLAPGGMVSIWAYGSGRQVEIGRYQSKKTVISEEEISQLDETDKMLFSEDWREEIMQNEAIIPIEIQNQNSRKSIPFGQWETYSKKYQWELEIHLPDNSKTKEVWNFFYNGEWSDLFGETILERHPNISEELTWNASLKKPIPKRINFNWLLDNRYSAKILFDEKEIFKAFQTITKGNPEEKIKLVIYVNEPKTYANIKLIGNNQEVHILDADINIRRTNLTY